MNPRTTIAAFASLAFGALAALGASGCGRGFVPATPSGFVDVGDKYPEGEYRAATADGVVLGIRSFDNDPKGPLDFWARTVERRMREMGGYALLDRQNVESREHAAKGVTFHFGHDEGREPFLYDLTVYVTDKKIFLLEAGGPKGEMQRQAPHIDYFVKNFLPK